MKHQLSFEIHLLLFKMCQKILLILGLAPYKLNIEVFRPKGTELTLKFSYSRIGCTYSILLIVILLSIMIIFLPFIIKWDYSDFGFVGKSIDMALLILGNSVALVTILIYCVHQHRIVDIGNQMNEFNRKIQLKLFLNRENQSRNFNSIIIILGFLLLSITLLIISWIIFQSFFLLSFWLCATINSCFVLQYGLIIKILREMAGDVNTAFIEINKFARGFPENQYFPGNYRSIVRNLGVIRRERTMIYRISNRVADFHALPSLLTIFFCCCHCVETLYFLIINLMTQQTSLFYILRSVLWILLIVYPIVIMSEMVKRFNAEMERTADILYDLRENLSLSGEIASELNDFAIELLHRKVVFSAYGFFSLDCTLLYSIFGMIVTYLIILLQFGPLVVSTSEPTNQ